VASTAQVGVKGGGVKTAVFVPVYFSERFDVQKLPIRYIEALTVEG